jgi:hypothetical protein
MVSMGMPTIDGDFIAGYGSLAIKAGRFVKVPILTGVVANEGTNFIPRRVKDWETFREHLIGVYTLPHCVASF